MSEVQKLRLKIEEALESKGFKLLDLIVSPQEEGEDTVNIRLRIDPEILKNVLEMDIDSTFEELVERLKE